MTDAPTPNPKPTRESCEARIVDIVIAEFGGRTTVAVGTLDNGHIVVAESHAATKEAFREAMGVQIATENVLEKVFQLEVYLWRERQWRLDGCPSFKPEPEADPPADDGPKLVLPSDRQIIKPH
jgi:hypothetical protein